MKQKYLAKALELLKQILQKSRYQKSAKGVISFWAILGYLISNTSKSVLRARIHFKNVVAISGLLYSFCHSGKNSPSQNRFNLTYACKHIIQKIGSLFEEKIELSRGFCVREF